MQKRANSARLGRGSDLWGRVRISLAVGIVLAGLSWALEFRCSIDVRTIVLASDAPIGPKGTSAEFSAAVGRV
ncbi:hypothetical protein ABLO27_11285 [Roseibium sp. SCPC15]|uniref:hypothetical protein n=1 Tax=Roseibium sp. SCP15 TaxID=3141376 RepID=UPI00333DEF38